MEFGFPSALESVCTAIVLVFGHGETGSGGGGIAGSPVLA